MKNNDSQNGNMIILLNEILHSNLVAYLHTGMSLPVQKRTLQTLKHILMKIIKQKTNTNSSASHSSSYASSKLFKKRKSSKKTTISSSSTSFTAAVSHSAARVLSVAPHLFFDDGSNMLDMISSIPKVGTLNSIRSRQ